MSDIETIVCPYCKCPVGKLDKHANTIEKKNIKDRTTIVVTCILVNTFEITLKPVTD